jgi:adenylate kinase
MKLLILGPPGSGKGTQSLQLSRRLAIPHISTGDLLRNAVRLGTPLGYSASECVAAGRLVPDALVNELVRERLGGPDVRDHGFLLDGFPRNIDQLDALLLWLASDTLDASIELAISDEVAVRRLTARGRPDDTPSAIRERLQSFERETRPVLRRLDERGLLISLEADRPIGDVTEELLGSLRNRRQHAQPTSLDRNAN